MINFKKENGRRAVLTYFSICAGEVVSEEVTVYGIIYDGYSATELIYYEKDKMLESIKTTYKSVSIKFLD